MYLSVDAFNSYNIYKCEKLYTKKDNFGTYYLIVHISFNFAFRNLKFLVAVDDIQNEGNVSQNFDICLSFCFMSKNFFIILLIFFSKFNKK